ncbi:MAG TPA: hypothetical protein VFG87_11835 [Amycolatopsis sp.]|nr:hypothetical protein [Amycolatopsis sp.]
MRTGLPPFYCPIAPALHPRVEWIRHRALAWADSIGLYRTPGDRARGVATHSAELACRVLPAGRDDLVWLFSAWNYWSFALSDGRDDITKPRSAADIADFTVRIFRALDEPGYRRPDATPLESALADLIDRTRDVATAVQFRRLAEGVRDWLLALTWQTTHTERGSVPTLDDFAAMRTATRGTRLFAAWIEIGSGVTLPGEQRWAASVRALTTAAGFIVSCDNDIVGHVTGNRVPGQNIVDLLAARHDRPVREALTAAKAIRDSAMIRFLGLRNGLARNAGSDLHGYLRGLNHYLRGSLDWMDTAPRYTGARDRPSPRSRLGLVITGIPPGKDTGPPDIPAVKWWWRL